MTAEEKAKELYDKYFWTQYPIVGTTRSKITKQCALICVDIILNDVGAQDWEVDTATKTNYWQEVKKELEKL